MGELIAPEEKVGRGTLTKLDKKRAGSAAVVEASGRKKSNSRKGTPSKREGMERQSKTYFNVKQERQAPAEK